MEAPDAVPLHRHVNAQFHDLHPADVSPSFHDCQAQFHETLLQLLDPELNALVEDLDALMDSFIESYQALSRQATESSDLARQFDAAKRKYKEESDKCERISLENWDLYRNKSLEAPKLSEWPDIPIAPNSTQTTDKKELLLKALPYIWKDPTCVIPDNEFVFHQENNTNRRRTRRNTQRNNDDDDEDELEIQGGSIELVCPITFKPYETPMISRKCGHIFDKEGITSYLQGYNERDCPQGACGRKVSISDFAPDELMALRCRIAKIRQDRDRKTAQEQDFDIL